MVTPGSPLGSVNKLTLQFYKADAILLGMSTETCLRQKLSQIWPHLNERSRRMLAAAEAMQLGRGGVSLVSRACGLSRVTITKGIRELGDDSMPPTRVRREGGGRPKSGICRSNLAWGIGSFGRAVDKRGSGIAVTLDMQKHPCARQGTRRSRPSGQPREGCSITSRHGL